MLCWVWGLGGWIRVFGFVLWLLFWVCLGCCLGWCGCFVLGLFVEFEFCGCLFLGLMGGLVVWVGLFCFWLCVLVLARLFSMLSLVR